MVQCHCQHRIGYVSFFVSYDGERYQHGATITQFFEEGCKSRKWLYWGSAIKKKAPRRELTITKSQNGFNSECFHWRSVRLSCFFF